MNSKKYQPGENLSALCAVCEDLQQHSVLTATKSGAITKLLCTNCNTVDTYKNGVKTSTVAVSAKTGKPYDQAQTYRKGQTMTHATFGRGEVTQVIDTQKIDVLFGDTVKRLVHSRN